MKTVICGAGQVGYTIASYLSRENNDITIIDNSPELVARASHSLDINGIIGFASHPDVLESADIRRADMIIAVTASDEVNMVACQVAHSLFNVPKKVARIRHQSYRDSAWSNLFSRYNMPIDVIISPEFEVARAITNRLIVPGTTNDVPLADGRLHLIGIICEKDCPLLNTAMKQYGLLFPDLNFSVLAIFRGTDHIIPDVDVQLLEGDEVYLLAETKQLSRVLAAFGHYEKIPNNVTILGGGNVGNCLAHYIQQELPDIDLKIIEVNPERAQYLSETLEDVLVINGDGVTSEIIDEAGLAYADMLVSVTQNDEENILGALLAKQAGCKSTITLVNKDVYAGLVLNYGIDAVINPRSVTVSNILHHVRRGRIKSVNSIRDGAAEVIEAEASETCNIIHKPFSEITEEKGIIAGAIIRKSGEIIFPSEDTRVEIGDTVILLAPQNRSENIENLFSFSIDLF